ncbi:MAG: hypothetical protein ACKO0U_00835 [Gammaproteobacteria bacterium]
MSHWPWDRLQLEPTADTIAIRRAYARELRGVHPEEDPQGFQALREAYERALQESRWQNVEVPEDETEAAPSPGEEQPEQAPAAGPATGHDEAGDPEATDAPVPPSTPKDPARAAMADALANLLAALQFHEADSAHVASRVDAALAALAGLTVDDADRYTEWLGEELLQLGPAGLGHLEKFRRQLGWESDDALDEPGTLRYRVMQRLSGEDFLRSVRIPNSPLYPAWQLLTEASAWRRTLRLMRRPRLANQARELFVRLSWDLPTAIDELPPASVAYWNAWMDRGVWRPWVNNFIVASLLFALLAWVGEGEPGAPLFWGTVALAIAAAGAFWLFAIERPSRRELPLPDWLRPGAAIGVFVWPLLVAFAEPLPARLGWWAIPVFLPVAIGGWLLALTRQGSRERGQNVTPIRHSLMMNLTWTLGVMLWLAVVASGDHALAALLSPTLIFLTAGSVLAVASVNGEAAWWWEELALRTRRQGLLLAAVWTLILGGWFAVPALWELAPGVWLMACTLTSLAARSLLMPSGVLMPFRGWLGAGAGLAGYVLGMVIAQDRSAMTYAAPAVGLLGLAMFEYAQSAWHLRRSELRRED